MTSRFTGRSSASCARGTRTSLFIGRRQFLLIGALFGAPLLAAWLLYFAFPEFQPAGKTNYGELVNPARPLPALTFHAPGGASRDRAVLEGRWTYLYLGGSECGEGCKATLFQNRQVRTLLNEKRQRVQRVYLAPDVQALEAARMTLAPEHPDLLFLTPADPGAIQSFFTPSDPQALYLLDPHANWLMRYPGSADPKGMLKDIKKLLRNSQIG